MALFSFQSEQQFVSSIKSLRDGIHKVKLTECKYEQIEDKSGKNNGQPYNVLTVTFGNENGSYTHRLFEPTHDYDNQRSEFPGGGQAPSRIEQQQQFIGQLLTIFSPESLQKLFGKNVDFIKLMQFIEKELSSKIGNETNIKLILNKNGYATLPDCAGLTKDGKVFPKNVIGENLSFTPREIEKINLIKNAKPTNVHDAIEGNDADVTGTEANMGAKVDNDLDLNL